MLPPPTARGCRVARHPPVLCSCSGLAMAPVAPVVMDIRGSIGMLERNAAWLSATVRRSTSRWTPKLLASFGLGIGIGEEVPGRWTAACGKEMWPRTTLLHFGAELLGALKAPAPSLLFYVASLSWSCYGHYVHASVQYVDVSMSGVTAVEGGFTEERWLGSVAARATTR